MWRGSTHYLFRCHCELLSGFTLLIIVDKKPFCSTFRGYFSFLRHQPQARTGYIFPILTRCSVSLFLTKLGPQRRVLGRSSLMVRCQFYRTCSAPIRAILGLGYDWVCHSEATSLSDIVGPVCICLHYFLTACLTRWRPDLILTVILDYFGLLFLSFPLHFARLAASSLLLSGLSSEGVTPSSWPKFHFCSCFWRSFHRKKSHFGGQLYARDQRNVNLFSLLLQSHAWYYHPLLWCLRCAIVAAHWLDRQFRNSIALTSHLALHRLLKEVGRGIVHQNFRRK